MNEHTLILLEFDRLLDNIAAQAQSAGGVALLKALKPSAVPERITQRRNLYQDLIAMRNTPLELPSLHIGDIKDLLHQLAPEGAVLEGVELLACREVLDVTADLRDFAATDGCTPYTVFRKMCAPLDACDALRADLDRCLDRDGTVLDNATPRLRELRREAAALEVRIQRRLEQMVHSQELDSSVQERFVTLRNGRYVIPVKRDARGGLPGIVHDLSNSGQTVFVEPTETLGLGNDLAKARLDERDEVIRILASLSAALRASIPAITTDEHIIHEIDAAAAIARWAGWNDCELPQFGRALKLENARHPLLQLQFRNEGDGRAVVPLNISLPDALKAMAITGSNTGGKTVVLKTVGLLCLAAQSGLPVPAGPGSVFPVFDNILADIGDEQSIQNSLSTFSAHVMNITSILREAGGGRSLVLLDELGGGTDPVEGGAIACAVLDYLAARNALCIVTTHLALVKNFVHTRREMLNASVRFNVQTLKPEYILDVGRPGASHAILIARRLGMPQEVLDKAQQMMSSDQLKLEDMLTRMEADQRRIATHAEKMADAESDLTARRDALAAELEELRRQRREMLLDANRQAEALVNNARREMENLLRDVREAAKAGDMAAVKARADAARQALEDRERRINAGIKTHTRKARSPLTPGELKPGLRVWVERLHSHGVVEYISGSGNNVSVHINGVPFAMKAGDLEHSRDGVEAEVVEPVVRLVRPKVTGRTPSEVNVIGMRVEDALSVLGDFIDRAVLARLPEVRIIHGFGTGRLRSGIHVWLNTNPSVKSYYQGRDGKEPGGGGCTIVTLDN